MTADHLQNNTHHIFNHLVCPLDNISQQINRNATEPTYDSNSFITEQHFGSFHLSVKTNMVHHKYNHHIVFTKHI